MKVITTEFRGLFVLQPKVFEDPRGIFFESYNQREFSVNGLNYTFVQDNESFSKKGVLRGIHFQKPPFEQAKLVRVIQGSALDVVVDIRKSASTYGKHFSIVLSGKEKNMLLVPEGFAHAFLTLEENTLFSYKCSNFYNKESEASILWNDSVLGINWGLKDPLVSEKDMAGMRFREF